MLIADKLHGRYKRFLKYCASINKKNIEELSDEDIVAYGETYYASPRELENLRAVFNDVDENLYKKFLFAETFQRHFGIKNLKPFRNTYIEQLSFVVRARHFLIQANIETIADLLKYSPRDFILWENVGPKSIRDIYEVLERYINSLDEDTLAEARSENFSDTDDTAPNLENITHKIGELPAQIKDKPLQPFIEAYNFNHERLFKDVPPDLKVIDFDEYLAKNFDKYDADNLYKFVKWLKFDLNAIIQRLFTVTFEDTRAEGIVYERSLGKTLEDVGEIFKLTRERARQIAERTFKRFLTNYKLDEHNFFLCLHALIGRANCVYFKDAEKFLGYRTAKILWWFALKIPSKDRSFFYDKGADTLLFSYETNSKNLRLEDLEELMADGIVHIKTVENFAREKKYPLPVIEARLEVMYSRTGQFFHNTRITVAFKCAYILKEYFPKGFKVADSVDCDKLNHYLKELFDDSSPLSQRNVDANVARVGMLAGRGWYIHPDLVNVSQDILDAIKNFIDNSDRRVFQYKEIFKELKDVFAGTQITNRHILQGIIKFHKLPYILMKDYLAKDGGLDITDELSDFVKRSGDTTRRDIKAHFALLSNVNVDQILIRCEDVIQVNGLCFHVSHLDLREEDFVEIGEFLQNLCEGKFVRSADLFEVFSAKFSEFMTRNKIDSHLKLYGIMRYMFKDKLHFSGLYVSTENVARVNKRKIILKHFQNVDSLEIIDLMNFCDDSKIPTRAMSYLISIMRPEFIRADEFSLWRPEKIGVTEEVIDTVCEELRKAIARNGGWQTAQTFDTSGLPPLKVAWTDFLVEGVASLAKNKLPTLRIISSSFSSSSVVFVADEFAQGTFQEFLVKILIEENKRKPFRTQAELAAWVKEQGLCWHKLPQFLFRDGYLDDNGKISLR